MTDLSALAARVEAGEGEQYDLLWQAFEATRGPKPPIWAVEFEVHTPEYSDYVARGWQFGAMLEANAYESAALMLVPDGMIWGLANSGLAAKADLTRASALVGHPDSTNGKPSEAATPALALTAAALRSRA